MALWMPTEDAAFLVVLVAVAASWLAVPFAEGAWAAYRASRGGDYRYLLDRVTSAGGSKASRRTKKGSRIGLFDDDSDEDDFGSSEDGSWDSGDSSGDSDFGGDFGGDSGSW